MMVLVPFAATAEIVINDLWYDLNDDGASVSVIKCNDLFYQNFTIPSEITMKNGQYPVTSIADYAFESCNHMTSITIPHSVTSIGKSAFAGCSSLTSITIPNSVTSIGVYAFSNCRSLTSITISNSVLSIADGTFARCSALNSLKIPNSVTTIGDDAFEDCSDLTSVTIGNSVTSIGYGAFKNCKELTSVHINNLEAWSKIDFKGTWSNPLECAHHLFLNDKEIKDLQIPSSVRLIKDNALKGCSGLTSVVIPGPVTSIGYNAFSGCSGLTSVTIGGNVNSIGGHAFWNVNPSKIYCLNTTAPVIESTLLEVFNCYDATVYVPIGCRMDYYGKGWGRFNKIVEWDFSGIEEIEAADNEMPIDYYNLNGIKVLTSSSKNISTDLPTGIYITRIGNKFGKVVVR